jgi:ribonuclease P protein component
MGNSCSKEEGVREERGSWWKLEKSEIVTIDKSFPKEARLLKSREFNFKSYKPAFIPPFKFIYTVEGQGRLGISLSKKNLKRAVARNRVKRLIKESFREIRDQIKEVDLHVVGTIELQSQWKTLDKAEIKKKFDIWIRKLEEKKKAS